VAGCNITNTVVFLPWVFLNFAALTSYFVSILTSNFYVHLAFSTLSGLYLTKETLSPYARVDIIFEVFRETMVKELPIFGYLLLTIIFGLVFIVIT
jgi:accessory gene regulator protein AgrB